MVAQSTPPAEEGFGEGPSKALALVNAAIDNRLAIIGASAAVGIRPERLKLGGPHRVYPHPQPVDVRAAQHRAGDRGGRAAGPGAQRPHGWRLPRAPQGEGHPARGVPRARDARQALGRGAAGGGPRLCARRTRCDYEYGLEPYLRHKPDRSLDPGPLTYAYAVIFYRDGSRQFDVMSAAEIEDIRKRSSQPGRGPVGDGLLRRWPRRPRCGGS